MYNSALAMFAAVPRDGDEGEEDVFGRGGVVALLELSGTFGFARPMYESAR